VHSNYSLFTNCCIEAWREGANQKHLVPSRNIGRIVHHILPNPRSEAWPLDSYTRRWFRGLIALILISVMIYIIHVLADLAILQGNTLGNAVLSGFRSYVGYVIPIANLGVVVFYTALFTLLETVRFSGIWHKLLMDILPVVLVTAWCAGQICWILFWWWGLAL